MSSYWGGGGDGGVGGVAITIQSKKAPANQQLFLSSYLLVKSPNPDFD